MHDVVRPPSARRRRHSAPASSRRAATAVDRTRVLHVVVDFDGREAAGRFVIEVAKRAPELEVHVSTNRLVRRDGDVTVHEVGGRPGLFPFTRWRRIRRLLDTLDIDVVHLHGGVLLPLIARSPAFRRRPLVLSVYAWPRLHGRELTVALRHSRHQRKTSTSLLLANLLPPGVVGRLVDGTPTQAVLTPDPQLAYRLRRLAATPVHHIGGGSRSDVARARFEPEHPTIAFAGRAETARGVDTLVRAMPAVLAVVPGARLRLMVLPSRELDAIRGLVSSCGIEGRVCIETQSQPDLAPSFAEATVGVFPFKHDHATLAPPLTVVEAMSAGLPVVATSVACMSPVVVDGVNGLLVPRDDPTALAAAIVRIIGDGSTWRRMSDAALGTVRRTWTWDHAARATTGAYPRTRW